MSEILEIPAQRRERAGKGAARASRRAGMVPAVIYGGQEAPDLVDINFNFLLKVLNQGGFKNKIFKITVDGKSQHALPKDLQVHPVKEMPIHIDFQRLVSGGRVTKNIRVEYVDREKSPGLKQGGILYEVSHEVTLTVPVDHIPSHLVVSLEGLNIGDSLHLSQVQLPEGCRAAKSRINPTLVTIQAAAD
jgi:large subunit ribosomal protein L25